MKKKRERFNKMACGSSRPMNIRKTHYEYLRKIHNSRKFEIIIDFPNKKPIITIVLPE